MTEQMTTPRPANAPQPTEDLSRQIEQAIDQLPDEEVRAVRLFGDCYRCNWWVEDKKATPYWIVTGTIRRSRFLRASKTAAGLMIDNRLVPSVEV